MVDIFYSILTSVDMKGLGHLLKQFRSPRNWEGRDQAMQVKGKKMACVNHAISNLSLFGSNLFEIA